MHEKAFLNVSILYVVTRLDAHITTLTIFLVSKHSGHYCHSPSLFLVANQARKEFEQQNDLK